MCSPKHLCGIHVGRISLVFKLCLAAFCVISSVGCANALFDLVFLKKTSSATSQDGASSPTSLLPTPLFSSLVEKQPVGWGQSSALFGSDGNYLATPTMNLNSIGIGRDFAKVAGGVSHACGLSSLGEVYCWGAGGSGRLGLGDVSNQSTPMRVTFADPSPKMVDLTLATDSWSNVAAHTCSLSSEGDAYCWGAGTAGQLGNGTSSDRLSPSKVVGELKFHKLSLGSNFTCGLTTMAEIYCWGSGTFGELGNGISGPGTLSLVPVPVTKPTSAILFRDLAASAVGVCALTLASDPASDGILYCWGMKDSGATAWISNVGSGVGQTTYNSFADVSTPKELSLVLRRFKSLSSGSASSLCAIDLNDHGWCWGHGMYARLGNGYRYYLPQSNSISSSYLPAVLDIDGSGTPTSYTAGTLNFNSYAFQPVKLSTNTKFKKIVTEMNSGCAVSLDNDIWCWGRTDIGAAGPIGRGFIYSAAACDPILTSPASYTISQVADCQSRVKGHGPFGVYEPVQITSTGDYIDVTSARSSFLGLRQ